VVSAEPAPPKVTVIIATYNWATVLPYSIGSVLSQTFTDFELLVIGDGCTDESEEVVTTIADPRVQWTNLPTNSGHQAVPNNDGLRRARGEVVAHLGHDDLWLPRHLEHLVAAIDEGATVAHSRVLMVGPHAARARPQPGWQYRPGRWIAPTSVVYRRDAIVEVGGWSGPLDVNVVAEERTVAWSPEGELWQRVAVQHGPPVLVDRLTCVKLPALVRRNVYRTRPSHEQALWASRIRAAEDPERDLLAFQHDDKAASLRGRVARSFRFRTQGLRRRLDPRTHEQKVRSIRRRKGLDP
jgi:glycosyltransferase involved in cell wall biosynthesis